MSKTEETLNLDLFEDIVVFNSLFRPNYFAQIYDSIKPEFFLNKENKFVLKLLSDYFQRNNDLPKLEELKIFTNTEEEKQSIKNVLLKIRNFSKDSNEQELFNNTERFLKEKAVYHGVLETVNECAEKKGTIDTAKILHRFEEACSINLHKDFGLDYFADIDRHIEDLIDVKKKMSTGWNWLDEKLGGGWLESGRSLYVFMGVVNVGKSLFLANAGANLLAQNKKVLIVTLEMSEMAYAKRISSILSGLDYSSLPTEHHTLRSRMKEYSEQHAEGQLIIKEFPTKSLSPLGLKNYLEELRNKKKFKPDVILLDYLNLMTDNNKHNNSYEAVKEISEKLRALSYPPYSCPIITATQFNREAINVQDPGMDKVSESLGTAMTADVMMSIWREEGDDEEGFVKLSISKNRDGEAFGTKQMQVDFNTLKITECDGEAISMNSISKDTLKAFSQL